jgi:hypothetical protein
MRKRERESKKEEERERERERESMSTPENRKLGQGYLLMLSNL